LHIIEKINSARRKKEKKRGYSEETNRYELITQQARNDSERAIKEMR